jgi:formylglycine-generating enzyme required for sulfatase activity
LRSVLLRLQGLARRPVFWLGVLLLLALVGVGIHYWPDGKEPVQPPPPQVIPTEPASGELRTVRASPPPGAKPFNPINTRVRWAGVVLALAALALATIAGERYRRERALPQPVPAGEGPAWLPRLTLEVGAPELLDGEQIRTLVWGIGRFVSEDLTDQVDPERTVAATARAGGIAELRYRHVVYPREVWLWQDEATEDPSLQRLADELEVSLDRAGLPVRRGWFAEVPDVLRWREGQEFSPQIFEGHRESTLVAVLTDGAGLAIAHDSALGRARLVPLLRSLSGWPRLAFVDFGQASHGLAALLKPYGLRCIAPAALPAFLGEGQIGPAPVRRAKPGLLGELRAWAAATALSAEPVDAVTAYALRRSLRLGISALGFERLLKNGENLGGRLTWAPARRVELLNWLALAEAGRADGQVPPDGLLSRALAFWRSRYREERAWREEHESPLLPWKGTSAEQRLSLEEALLALWTAPAEAARSLYGLFQGALATEVRERLAGYAPRDWSGHSDRVRLPWRWANQPEKVRWLYARMGLGGEGALAPRGDLRPSATLGVVLGLCLGLLLAALAAILWPPTLDPTLNEWTDPESGITFVRIPGGSFLMGSPKSEEGRYSNEGPQHRVTLSPFWMAKTEVTNAQYRRLHPDHAGPDEHPAAAITWYDAKDFCEHYGFHLPTEAQWEYAARAGTMSRWSFGNDEADLGRHTWYWDNADRKAHPVGTRAPNPWGLHDMHGNVWEWVEDCYDEQAYSRRPSELEDPLVLGDQCQYRVGRGGSAWNLPRNLRSARRGWLEPKGRRGLQGFRCVRVPSRQLAPLGR